MVVSFCLILALIVAYEICANKNDNNIHNIGKFQPAASSHKHGKIHQRKDKLILISFVNGIYHTEEEWREIALILESLFDSNVYPFYNPSTGNWMKDATKAGVELIFRSNNIEVAKDLTEHLRSLLNQLPPNGRLLHLAHSGGAILTYLAARHHLTASEISRIDVATFGGGRSITRKYFKGRLYNYYSKNDPVMLVEKRAANLMKKIGNSTIEEIRDSKHNTSFVFITPQANHLLLDHAMEGPTYRIALEYEVKAYNERLVELQKFIAKEADYIRILRKKTAKLTGAHHFWDRFTPANLSKVVRKVRKVSANTTNIHNFFSQDYWNNMLSYDMFGKKILKDPELALLTLPSSANFSNDNETVIENLLVEKEENIINIGNNETSKKEIDNKTDFWGNLFSFEFFSKKVEKNITTDEESNLNSENENQILPKNDSFDGNLTFSGEQNNETENEKSGKNLILVSKNETNKNKSNP